MVFCVNYISFFICFFFILCFVRLERIDFVIFLSCWLFFCEGEYGKNCVFGKCILSLLISFLLVVVLFVCDMKWICKFGICLCK